LNSGRKELALQKLSWEFACRKKDRDRKKLQPLKQLYDEEFSTLVEKFLKRRKEK